MPCVVFGPGLVGSFLGAAAEAPQACPRTLGAPIEVLVRLPSGERRWCPDSIATPRAVAAQLPLLVTTRCHQTPWERLPDTCLAAQNGLGQPRPVAVCFMAIDRSADGTVHARGPHPRVVLRAMPTWQPVIAAWREAGLEVEEVDDVRPAQWEKAILNATVGPLCRAHRLGMGAVWADSELRRLVLAATVEGMAIARAAGIVIDEEMPARAITFFSQVGEHRPSVLADAGELPWILGTLISAAARYRVAAPSLKRIAEAVGHAERAGLG